MKQDRPRLIGALEPTRPDICPIMAGLRRRISVAGNASEGVTGQFVPKHVVARLVWWSDRKQEEATKRVAET